MNKKSLILPISFPAITTYPANTANLAVASCHKDYKEWLYNNNIQLIVSNEIADTDGRYAMLEFFPFQCPLINRVPVYDILLSNKDIVKALIQYLNNNFYVMIEIDMYYVPQSMDYLEDHEWQPILVYGYNSEQELFHVAGFFEESKYHFSNIESEVLREAYANLYVVEHERLSESKVSLSLISIQEFHSYHFNIMALKDQIFDYLYSVAPKSYVFSEILSIRDVTEFTFGIAIYELIKRYLIMVKDNELNCDLRLMHTLHQHKKLWVDRLAFLYKNGVVGATHINQLHDLAKQLMDKADLLRNYAVKYNLINELTLLNKMTATLSVMYDVDLTFCKLLLECL